MLADRVFCSKASNYLRDDFFSGELSWFYRKVTDFFKEFGRSPGSEELAGEILKHKDQQDLYRKELDSILATESIGRDYLKKELTAFIQANIFVSSIKESVDLYNSGNRQSCYDFIRNKLAELHDADFENDRLVRFGDADRLLELAALQTKETIPTGIHIIDQSMQGGMMPQTWTTFLGGSNVGKSMLCPNLAKAACLLKKKRTFVMIHEDEEIPTKLRYLSCFSEVPYNRLVLPKSMRSEEDNKKIKEADELIKEYVILRFMYGKEAFVESVCDQARRMLDQWEYHLLIDDYLQCLKTKAFKTMDSLYSLHEHVTGELKQLCCELNVAGAGGAQVNRLAHKMNRSGADLLRCTDVGDSWGTVKKSSNVITMNRSESDVEENRIVFLLDKVRNGHCPVAVQCVSSYDRCATHLFANDDKNRQIQIPVEQK
jgi:hypothetical protein